MVPKYFLCTEEVPCASSFLQKQLSPCMHRDSVKRLESGAGEGVGLQQAPVAALQSVGPPPQSPS